MSTKNWSVWTPGNLISHGVEVAASDRGRVFRRVDALFGLTREEAEVIARNRHGDEAIVTRKRGWRKDAVNVAYEADLRPE